MAMFSSGQRVVMKDQWPGIDETTVREAGVVTDLIPGDPKLNTMDAIRFKPDNVDLPTIIMNEEAFDAEQ